MTKKILIILAIILIILAGLFYICFSFGFFRFRFFYPRIERKERIWGRPGMRMPGRGMERWEQPGGRFGFFRPFPFPKRIWAGTIKSLGKKQFVIETLTKEEKTVICDDKTQYHSLGKGWQGTFSDLKVNASVRVFGNEQNGKIQANRVIILPERPWLTPGISVTPGITVTPTPELKEQ